MRFIGNILITVGLLLAFNAFNWLTLSNNSTPVEFSDLTWPMFGKLVLIALVMVLVTIVAALVFAFGVAATFGVGVVLYPFLGWAILKGAEYFMPETLTLHGFWISVLCGWLLLIAKIPERSNS